MYPEKYASILTQNGNSTVYIKSKCYNAYCVHFIYVYGHGHFSVGYLCHLQNFKSWLVQVTFRDKGTHPISALFVITEKLSTPSYSWRALCFTDVCATPHWNLNISLHSIPIHFMFICTKCTWVGNFFGDLDLDLHSRTPSQFSRQFFFI